MIQEASVDGPQKSKSLTTSQGTVHASVRKISGDKLSQGSTVSAGDAEAALPGEVASAVKVEEDEVAVVVLVEHPDVNFVDQGGSITTMEDLGTKAVELTVSAVSAQGGARNVEVESLAKPISLSLKITLPSTAVKCAAWDAESQAWSTVGLTGEVAANEK